MFLFKISCHLNLIFHVMKNTIKFRSFEELNLATFFYLRFSLRIIFFATVITLAQSFIQARYKSFMHFSKGCHPIGIYFFSMLVDTKLEKNLITNCLNVINNIIPYNWIKFTPLTYKLK